MVNHIQKSDNASGPTLPLPVRPEQVSCAWLESALRVQRPRLKLTSA
jgi:hypothetical protein